MPVQFFHNDPMQLTKNSYLRRALLVAPFIVLPFAIVFVDYTVRSDCSFPGVLQRVWHGLTSWKTFASEKSRMRLLKTDGDLQLWATPIGHIG